MVKLNELNATKKPASDIYAVYETKGNDGGVNRLIEIMDKGNLKFYKTVDKGESFGPDGIISSNDVVLLKVNSQWDERGGTNTDLIKEVIRAVLNHPDGFIGEIVVVDNGQAQYGSTRNGGSFDYEKNNAYDTSQSVRKVCEGYAKKGEKVSCYLWDIITEKVVSEYSDSDFDDGFVLSTRVNPETGVLPSYPKFVTSYGSKVSFKHGVWSTEKNEYEKERLKILNIPVLKCHFIFGVTGAMKHYMGVNSDKLTAKLGYRTHTTVGRGGMGTLMAATRVPALNILDAIFINARPNSGPMTTYAASIETNIIAASTDPVAIDYWASKNILMQAMPRGFGLDTTLIDPDNTNENSFGVWLKRAAAELNTAGYPFTYDPARMNVRVTER